MKTFKKVTNMVLGAALVAVSAMGAALPVSAATYVCPNGDEASDLTECDDIGDNANNNNDLMSTLNTIINVIIGVIGFIAVVMIILGGVQYTTSAGAADKVKTAKDTIMYGIIGLVIAVLAFAIVNFVLSSVFGK